MSELPTSLYPAAATILFGLLCSALGIIGFFLKDIRQQLKEENQQQDLKIEAIKQDVASLREDLPLKYVLRDDFVRAIAGLDHKMDRMGREVSLISNSLNQLIGKRDEK